MNFLALSIYFLYLCLIANCQDFCDIQFKDQLIDSVFSFNDTIYALRKPENVWILRIDKNTGNWTQIGEKINLNDLFVGHSMSSFESAFSISGFAKCESADNCQNSLNFNPTNVTFVFSNDSFYIFRRINERKFIAVDDSDQNIPWKENRYNSSKVIEFFKINDRIDGAVIEGPDNDTSALIYSVNTIHKYRVTQQYFISANWRELTDSPAKEKVGNGGITVKEESIFIVDNKLWHWNGEQFRDLNQNSWDYFSCDYKTIIPSDTITTDKVIAKITSEETTTKFTSKFASSEETTTSEPVSKPSSVGIDENFRKQIKFSILMLFIISCITGVLVTYCAFLGYKTLTQVRERNYRNEKTKSKAVSTLDSDEKNKNANKKPKDKFKDSKEDQLSIERSKDD